MTKATQLKCVILTLRRVNILLPNAMVAEIISVKDLKKSENTPGWYIGKMDWRGEAIPLLSFEAAGGDEIANVNLNTQAVVLYAVSKSGEISDSPFIGLVMSGVPHVTRFSRKQINIDSDPSDDHPMVAQKVRINGASVSILDVEAMVDMVDKLAA
jgi:chemosensory pili system protein ChpC